MQIKHFLRISDFSVTEIKKVIRISLKLKKELKSKGKNKPLFKGKTLAMIFEKPSLRTRTSFEIGMTQLAGHAIYLGPQDIQMGKRETPNDVGEESFVDHLHYGQRLKDRIPRKKLKWVIEKVPKGGKIHHSFHVFSVFTRTGHHTVDHTLDTMDQCRIGWGKIIKGSGQKLKSKKLKVKTQKLIYENGKLSLKNDVIKEISLPVDNGFLKNIKAGDWVSFHWGFVCDKISTEQVARLKNYTKINLKLANETI